jgi:hypothetical protein
MNTDEAFIRGANAYHKGEIRAPILDPYFHPFTNMTMIRHKLRIKLYTSWLKGWDTANLEYVESDIAEHEAATKAEAYNELILTHGRQQFDPEQEHEEAHERWLENLRLDQAHLNELKASNTVCDTGVRFNKDGSVSLSAEWIKRNAE